MSRTEPISRAQAVTLVATLCVVLGGISALSGIGAASGSVTSSVGSTLSQTTTDSSCSLRIERGTKQETFVVSMPDSRSNSDVNVSIGDERKDFRISDSGAPAQNPDWVRLRDSGSGSGCYRYEIDFTVFAGASGGNPANKKVSVEARGESVSKNLDLRYLVFQQNGKVYFENGDTLVLPVRRTLGFRNGQVETTVEPLGVPLTGVVESNGRGNYALHLNAAPLRKQDPDELESVSFRVNTPAEGSRRGSVPLLKRANEASSIEVTDGGLQVQQPLIGTGEYDVQVNTSSPEGIYATTVTGDGGVLTIDHGAILAAETASVSVYRNDTAIVETSEKPIEWDAESISAVINDSAIVISVANRSIEQDNVESVYASWNATDATNETVIKPLSDAEIIDQDRIVIFQPDLGESRDETYRFIVLMGDGTVIRAEADGALGSGSGDAASGGNERPLPLVPLAGALFLFAILGTLGYFVIRSDRSGEASVSGESGERGVSTGGVLSARGTSERTVTVSVRDPVTGDRLAIDEYVHARRTDSQGARSSEPSSRDRPKDSMMARVQDETRSERATLRDGYATMALPQGRWDITLAGPVEATTTVDVHDDTEVILEPSPVVLSVQAQDAITGQQVDDVALTVTPDVGESTKGRIRDSSTSVRLSPQVRRVTVVADHDRYESESKEVSLDQNESRRAVTLPVTPRTGEITAVVTVEQKPVSGLRVEARARNRQVQQRQREPTRGTTDDQGQVRLQGCPVGAYEVTVSIDRTEYISEPKRQVTVEAESNTKVAFDLDFDFQLTRRQRERIERISERLSKMTSVSGRDTAIPRYYESVVRDLLRTIRDVPENGHLFATNGVDPNQLVDALLTQAETTVEQVTTAMSSKRNTDLFSASRDLPDYEGEWPGQYDIVRLFRLLNLDQAETGRLLNERLESTDQQIRSEEAELGSVAPARELWSQVRNDLPEESTESRTHATTSVFVSEGLLDAIERLFDDPELRKRLERTVF